MECASAAGYSQTRLSCAADDLTVAYRDAILNNRATLAQSAEQTLRKRQVKSSILLGGFVILHSTPVKWLQPYLAVDK